MVPPTSSFGGNVYGPFALAQELLGSVSGDRLQLAGARAAVAVRGVAVVAELGGLE